MAPLNQVTGQDFADALEAPALKPPTGVTANFEHPPNQNVYGYVALILCTSLASIFVLLRVYARVFYLKKVHIADCQFPIPLRVRLILTVAVIGLAAFVTLTMPISILKF